MSAQYPIEDGIPLPERLYSRKPSPIRDTLWLLEVDQSFHVPATEGREYTTYMHVRSKVEFARRKLGRSYSIRREVGGVRVWRVA